MDKLFDELIETEDGSFTLRHDFHGEWFHSRAGAKTEAKKLYIEASGLAAKLESSDLLEKIAILDIGLGLAYNACSTLDAWLKSPGFVDMTMLSIEKELVLIKKLLSKKANWQKNWPKLWLSFFDQVQEIKEGLYKIELIHPVSFKKFIWFVLLENLTDHCHQSIVKSHEWQYVWHDAFSPDKNPSLWQVPWFSFLRRICSSDCTLVTYSVAGSTRNSLLSAGWESEKIPGYGTKRAWLRAQPADLS